MTSLDFFTKIDTQLKRKLPFVGYRKPNENRVNAILQKNDRLHFLKDYAATGFVFTPFRSTKPSILLSLDEVLELSDFQSDNFRTEAKGLFTEGEEQRGFHINLIKKGIAEINAGNFDKIVLSRRLTAKTRSSPLVLFQKLLASYRNAFCYFWYHPKVGLWLGATPEILLMVRNRQLTTMSLAGTQLYDGDDNPNWGNKELEEQKLVTHFIIDALEGRVNNLRIKDVESVRAGNLMHLRTKVSGTMAKENLGAIVQALHPTPAVCGLPKNSTKEFILKNENYDREYYTGYLGEINFKSETQRDLRRANQENQAYKTRSNTTTLFVNLRCMQLKNEMAHIYVGGGITKDSDPEKEWDETVAKSETILRILR